LFAKTGGGGVSQLTGNSSQTDGWQWIGGVLIQWGKVTTASSGSFSSGTASGTVTFKNRGPVSQGIPFPSTCYTITTTPLFRTNTPSGAASVGVETTGGGFDLTNTGFNWLFSSNSGDYRGFFWMAIGI
jgi:hypothetical protein